MTGVDGQADVWTIGIDGTRPHPVTRTAALGQRPGLGRRGMTITSRRRTT